MIYLTYCKKLCKCHDVPPPITTINKKRKYYGMDRSSYWAMLEQGSGRHVKGKRNTHCLSIISASHFPITWKPF
jgi:hypothetical protein